MTLGFGHTHAQSLIQGVRRRDGRPARRSLADWRPGLPERGNDFPISTGGIHQPCCRHVAKRDKKYESPGEAAR
ncbi:hypothetical protein JYU34_006832 [Plutella xylostella]|uniref:Uncharacterized protein n=1 Tax=Plutella xylostella TaxID=51655 RepID=A0ABQ7QSY2_PLUXY|nr:hypothetical protein JYU34_006832 [Plutella xylostella]